MPQRKDPEVQVRKAVALVPWPGASAEKVEQLVTKKVEQQMAANAKVTKIESISRTSIAVIYVELDENLKETGKEFDDIKLKLDSIHDLPSGAGPINFIKDFGDTAALMLTVASPEDRATQKSALRARPFKQPSNKNARKTSNLGQQRFTFRLMRPGRDPNSRSFAHPSRCFSTLSKEKGFASDVRAIEGEGLLALMASSDQSDEQLLGYVQQFVSERMQAAEFHPDAWPPVIIRDPKETQAKLSAVAGDKYSYRQMDDFTDLIEKTLKTVPVGLKASRSGVLDEKIYLLYSQERLAAYGIQPKSLENAMSGRNISTPGGQVNVEGKNVSLDPTGEFKSENEIGDVLVPTNSDSSVYARDLVDIVRGYDNPARYLNYFNWRDAQGNWRRSRAITLSVQMRSRRADRRISVNRSTSLSAD